MDSENERFSNKKPGETPGQRIAYLISRYPSISHTFILREIQSLERLGMEIQTASVNSPDRDASGLTEAEREAVGRTFYLKKTNFLQIIRSHWNALRCLPFRYLSALFYAIRLAGFDLVRFLKHLAYFAEAVMVGEWMKKHNLAHLHIHFAGPASTVGLLATRTHAVTLSIMIHGPDEFYDVGGALLAEKMREASFIICIGDYARSQMMRMSDADLWDKLEVAPLGVDPSIFTPKLIDPQPEIFEILCVGRLVPAKGQHILLAAVEELLTDGRSVRLRFVGDGPDRLGLESAVRDRGLQQHVFFEGAVNQDRISALYSKAHAFSIASFAEGIPVVLMEAMAMEIPCVTTWITGIPELIRHEQDGLLVPPSNAKALVHELTRLMDDPALYRRIATQGRKRVLDRYHLENNVHHLAALMAARLEKLHPTSSNHTDH